MVPDGVEQAKCLAVHLKDRSSDYQIAHILSSDLNRALTTAQYISAALNLPVRPEPMLREMNNGDLAGMLNTTVLEQYPGLFFSTLNMDEPYPNGESPNDFYLRVKTWFSALLANSHSYNGNVLVVTHGGVINVLYHLAKEIPWSNKGQSFKAANCSIHILNLETMQFECENKIDFLNL